VHRFRPRQRVAEDRKTRYDRMVALRKSLVATKWTVREDVRRWRVDARAALSKCAAKPAAEGVDIGVDGIWVPNSFEVVEAMVQEQLGREGFAEGTLRGDGPQRPGPDAEIRRRRRAAVAGDREAAEASLPLPAGAAVGPGARSSAEVAAAGLEQVGGSSASAPAPRRRSTKGRPCEPPPSGDAAAAEPLPLADAAAAPGGRSSAPGGGGRPPRRPRRRSAGDDSPAEGREAVPTLQAIMAAERERGVVAMRPIDEIEQKLREDAPQSESAAWLQRRLRSSGDWTWYNRRNENYVYQNAVMEDPHRWWTRRLASRRFGPRAARQQAMRSAEVVFTVAVCNSQGNKEQEFDVLGSQPLYELRDAFHFASDWMFDGPTRLKSACFFIDGVFYVDRRHPDHLDYSLEIRDWLRATREQGFIRADTSKSMEVRVGDLERIPFGERCVYIHQGDMEHSVYFTGARLLHSHDDCPYPEAYPILTFMRRYNKRLCYACRLHYAMWIVIDSSRCPHNPSYWCQTCFRHFYQDAEGKYLPPVDYKIYPYLHDQV